MNSEKNNNLFPITLLMDRIISKFNPNNCKDLNITYAFIFDDHTPIYIEVSNGYAKILNENVPPQINTTIRTTHETWQKICLNEISAQNALIENLIKSEGEVKNYFLLASLLDKDLPSNVKNSAAFSSEENGEEDQKSNDSLESMNVSSENQLASTREKEIELNDTKTKPSNSNKSDLSGKRKKENSINKHKKTKVKKETKSKVKKDNKNLIPISSIMNGMIAGFDSSKADGLEIIYKFVFDDNKPIYLEIKNKTAKLYSKCPGEINTTITTSHETWHKIAFEGLSGEDALFDGLVKCEGSLKNFALLPKLFNPHEEDENSQDISLKLNPVVWTALALVPWIFYWSTHHLFSSIITSSFAVLYTTLFITFLKPPKYRRITKLESLTIIVFSFYHLFNILNPVIFNDTVSSFFLNIILILMFFMSVGSRMSIIGEYSQMSYDPVITNTKLFKLINKNITILWGIIFTLKFIIDIFVEKPLNNLSYLLILLGIVISYIYPKMKIGK